MEGIVVEGFKRPASDGTYCELPMPELVDTSRTDAAAREDGPVHLIDLDANANGATLPAVARAVNDAMLRGAANPSSAHRHGQAARRILEQARDVVSAVVEGSFEDGVAFTSGCTEANNAVILAGWHERGPVTIIATATEHPSVLQPAKAAATKGARVIIAPVDGQGRVDPDWIARAVDGSDGPVTVSVQYANSETGVIQPIAEIAAALAGRDRVLFHSDCAQAFGRLPIRVGEGLGPDVITVSGHKLHAPMGVGAIVMRADEDRVGPLLHGGSQERGIRAGTQSVPLIAGFAEACRQRWAHWDSDIDAMRAMRDALEASIIDRLPWAVVNGAAADRLPNTSNIRFAGVDGMAMVARLDEAGVSCSLGSACTSGHPDPSHVLTAMGISRDDAYASVRFSVSPLNDDDGIAMAVDLIVQAATCLRTSR